MEKKSVLVARADKNARSRLRGWLEFDSRRAYKVYEAADGDQAVALISGELASEPVVLLLDIDIGVLAARRVLEALDARTSAHSHRWLVIALVNTSDEALLATLFSGCDWLQKAELSCATVGAAVHNVWTRFAQLQRLQAQEYSLQAIHDSAQNFALITLDHKGIVASWNLGAEQLFGYTETEIVGRPIALIFTPEDRATDRPAFEMKMALETGHAHDTRWHQRKDGSTLWVAGAMTPLRTASGNDRGFLKIVQDRTEAKQAEEAVKIAQLHADAANRAKSEFLANMSHEIRSPMAAILGYADLLMARASTDKDREQLQIIRRNGHFLLNIVNDILDLSKIEAGRFSMTTQPLVIDELIGEVQSLMAVRAHEKQLTLSVEYATLVPERIETDPIRLRQILINLVGNAIKFTEQGSVRLVVRFSSKPVATIQVDVIDTGIGLSEEQQSRLFKPFSQADTSTTRQYGGTGLGLVISQRFAELLGGQITVMSQLGEGSTFTVTVTPGDLEDVAMIKPGQPAAGIKAANFIPPLILNGRILVVDDQADLRELTRDYIEAAGGQVETANDGLAALAAVEQAAAQGTLFDLIVLDMQMPGIDGFEATATLRARGFDRPILALTAGAMLGEREKCLNIGCDDYLSKPVDSRYLVEVIARRLAIASESSPQRSNASTGVAAAIDTISPPRRILLVEDNLDALAATAQLLSLAGHQIDQAPDGATALAAARCATPDVALLDLDLPDMTGYQLLSKLKAIKALSKTVFVALSGSSANSISEEDGFHHFFVKPVDIHELLDFLSLL